MTFKAVGRTPGRHCLSALATLVLLVCLLVAFVAAQVPAQSTPASGQASTPVAQQDRTGKKPDVASPEDWKTLSVKGLGWETLQMPGGTVERPEFTREYVRLQWRLGDPVDVVVVLPKGVKKPNVVLYLYSYPGDTSRFTNDLWCKGATEGGVAAVGFLSALTGERYRGNRPMKEWFVSELQESLGTTTHDVQMVLNYLEKRGDVNAERVGMYGQGSGATIAILAASVDSRIAVLDLLNPWGDWADWMKQSALVPDKEQPAYLRPEFLEKVATLDPVQILPKLRTPIVRIQQVADDPITPATARERIAAAAPRGAQMLQSENLTAYKKTWQEKKLWNWVKEQFEHLPVHDSAQVAASP